MVYETADRLKDFVHEKCGDELRTVVILKEDGWNGVYLRSDLRTKYDQETFDQVVESFRQTQLQSFDADYLPIGRRHAAVFYHDNAFVLQFRFSETETILVSLGTEVGRNLLEFVARCQRIIEEES